MKTPDLLVLLIEPHKQQKELLAGIFIDLGYQVIVATNVETALNKLFVHSPDIIVCQKELNEDSGFLLFSMLRNKMYQNETPFILLLNRIDKDDLSVGFELGIDSFIFPPFEPEKIDNIIQQQIKKSKTLKTDAVKQFKSFFEVTPFAIFVTRNRTIVDANKQFFKLVQLPDKVKSNYQLTDIFNFDAGRSNELRLLRCINGLNKYCSLRSVPLKSDSSVQFNLFLTFLENGGTTSKILGLLIPDDIKEQKFQPLEWDESRGIKKINGVSVYKSTGEDDIFTRREKQVLKLSAQGAPIKQIASQMSISVRTVEKHRSNIIRKTKTGNIVEAVFYANKKHLLELN